MIKSCQRCQGPYEARTNSITCPPCRKPYKHEQEMKRYREDAEYRNKRRASGEAWNSQNKERRALAIKAWRERNPDKTRQSSLRYYYANKEKMVVKRENQKLRSFGLTLEAYKDRLEYQANGCAICGNPCSTGRKLAIDHDHLTGRIRGLLCSNCNQGLGKFKDDIGLLRRAIAYLETVE